MTGPRTRLMRLVAAAAAVLAAGLLPVGASGAGSAAPAVEALSTLPQYVSGGDVLVEIRLHDDAASLKHLRIEANGRDVSASFRTMPDGSLRGLVDGLALGENEIVARANGQGKGTPPGRSATLRIVNHPISGPMFSGPQQEPFFCETVQNGLGPALDADCSAPTQVRYVYRTTAGAFATLADPAVKPADLAQTTTLDGRTVDYVVRIEKGVIDRAVYEIAALFDPAAPPSPFVDEPGWNGRLVYTFGGGCNVGYHQGQGNGGVLTDLFLARGYAVASSSLNVYDNNCSEVISAEVALMVKEHFAETYGKPSVHDRLWRLGRRDPAASDREQLPGHPRRDHPERFVPGLDHARNRRGLPTALAVLRQPGRCRRRLDGRAARRGLGLRHLQLVPVLAPRVRQPDERARGLPRRRARGGAVPPGDESGRDQVHELRADRDAARAQSGERFRLAAARQHRPPVRAHSAPKRGDHPGAVRLAERERRRLRLHRSGRPAARRRRSDRDRAFGYETGRVNTGGLGLASTPIIDPPVHVLRPPFDRRHPHARSTRS